MSVVALSSVRQDLILLSDRRLMLQDLQMFLICSSMLNPLSSLRVNTLYSFFSVKRICTFPHSLDIYPFKVLSTHAFGNTLDQRIVFFLFFEVPSAQVTLL